MRRTGILGSTARCSDCVRTVAPDCPWGLTSPYSHSLSGCPLRAMLRWEITMECTIPLPTPVLTPSYPFSYEIYILRLSLIVSAVLYILYFPSNHPPHTHTITYHNSTTSSSCYYFNIRSSRCIKASTSAYLLAAPSLRRSTWTCSRRRSPP